MDWNRTHVPYHYYPTNHWDPFNPLLPPGILPHRLPTYLPPAQYPLDYLHPRTSHNHAYTTSPSSQRRHRTSRHERDSTNLTKDTSTLSRSWACLCNSSQFAGCRCEEFSLLCYNLLAQNLLDMHEHELYRHCDRVYSRWDYRRYYLLEQLIDSSADVLCLQEMELSAYESFFSPNLKENSYWGVYKGRTGSHNDGVAIFFKTDKFELISSRQIEFNRRCRILDRDNVALIVKLRLKSSSHQDNYLYVATTHLLFNPKAGDVKLAQLCALLAELRELTSQDTTTHPVIVCGDFNFLPNSCLYHFLRTGYLNYKYLSRSQVAGYNRGSDALIPHPLMPPEVGINNACEKFDISSNAMPKASFSDKSFVLSHPYTFHSVYPHPITDPSLVSTFHGCAFENVDYIFYSSPELEIGEEEGCKASRQVKLVSRYSMPTRENLMKFGPLPNKFHSSDHLQLISKFCYIW